MSVLGISTRILREKRRETVVALGAHLRVDESMDVVAVDGVDVEEREASAGANELIGDRPNAVLAVRRLDRANAERIERAVEDSRPVPAAQKLHAVLFLLEALAGEAEDVADRLHHRVEHEMAGVARIERVFLHVVPTKEGGSSRIHVDVFVDPCEGEIQNAADDIDADEVGSADERGAVDAAGLAREDGRFFRAVPVHQAADEALDEGGVVGAHVEDEELRVFAAVREHDELLEGFLEDSEKHLSVLD